MRWKLGTVAWGLAALVFALFFAELVFFKVGRGTRPHQSIYIAFCLLYAVGFIACATAARRTAAHTHKPHVPSS